jgi:hypothetical protein
VAGALAANPWVNPASLDQPLQNQEAPDPTIDPDNLPDPEGMA